MRDAFAELGFPRLAWLDPEAVQSRFRQQAAALHPDTGRNAGGSSPTEVEQFASLQAAAATLLDPVRRLRHLLELETGTVPANGGMSPELQSLGLRAAKVFREAEQAAARSAAAGSALTRALELPALLEAREACESVQAEVQSRLAEAAERLKSEGDRIDPVLLSEVLAGWVYLQRWQDQARALLLRLELP